jgi:SAM-dependent methyltransferase
MGDKSAERAKLFRELIEQGHTKQCLQIGVRDRKYDSHWISVDRFDQSPLIDFHYDIQEMKFEDETFDIIVCNAILEHVENPQQAIAELYRVLKKEGRIWIEVPFNQPYHPSPNDYWRVTPEGIKIWMRDFNELDSGFFKIHGSALYNGIFYYGCK